MPNIQINIKDKVARGDGTIIICGNSDYVAHFDFDSEWDEYTAKTAHFEWGGKYEDVVFTGNECSVPVVYGVNALTIGVFAGDIRSTTPAFFKCVPCSQDSNSIPADPTPDVYNQLMEMLNKESGVWYPAVDDAGNMSWTRSMSETEPQPVNIKGQKGDAGTDGADGKSAYELAQDNGFAGTMQEWLASLVGADGANGADGKDGISPAVSVAAITGGNRITITDAEGAKTFDVMDGAQGASGADGKDYVLTNTDKQEIAETAAGLVDVPSVQPDWNQNDTTAADYIKNRPFYTGDLVETVLVEERTVPFADGGGAIRTTFAATVGETYKVYWDGTAYECTCVYFDGNTVIGNLSIIGAGSDTGEPFFMAVNNGVEIQIITADTSASHTFSISEFAPEVVKIDPKYLPMSTDDSYGIVKKSDIVSVYNFPARAEHDRMVEAIAAFETGNASIVWNGSNVIRAYYESSSDTISVVFAKEPLKLITFSNSDGFYVRALGSPTYGELQGNKMRIVNDEGAYTVLSTEGTPSDTTLSVSAGELYVYGEIGGHALVLMSSTPNSTKKFKITVDDSGAPTITDESDSTNTWKPTNLPTVAASDAGKFLRVSDTGEWVAETILSASGVSF